MGDKCVLPKEGVCLARPGKYKELAFAGLTKDERKE